MFFPATRVGGNWIAGAPAVVAGCVGTVGVGWGVGVTLGVGSNPSCGLG